MRTLRAILAYPISDTAADIRIGQVSAFAASVAFLAVSVWKLEHLDLTEAQLFLGALLSPVVPLLFCILGLLLPLSGTRKS